jgi:hypothetical protein
MSDVWRCLEIALVAGLGPTDFTKGVRAESAQVIRELFGRHDGLAMVAMAAEQHPSERAADERFTRIRALIARVLGPT